MIADLCERPFPKFWVVDPFNWNVVVVDKLHVTVSRGLATETLHRGGWPAGLAPLARPALELKGPASPLPSVPHHTRFSFAPTHPLHVSVALRRLGGAVGSCAAAPGQTQEEYEDRVEERGWRTEMGKVVLCLFACPRRRLLCIWF
jgi:hypothetical protein